MANLKIDWFGRSLSHRADKTSNTYATDGATATTSPPEPFSPALT